MLSNHTKLKEFENRLITSEPNFESRISKLERDLKYLKSEQFGSIEKIASL